MVLTFIIEQVCKVQTYNNLSNQHVLKLHIYFFYTVGWCQLISFMSSVCSFLSLWIVVALAIDRLFIHCWPAHAKQLCSTFRARIVILGMVVLSVVVYMNISLTRGVILIVPGVRRCVPLTMFNSALKILGVVDGVVNIAIPYICLLMIDVVMWKCSVVKFYQRIKHRASRNVMVTNETLQTITIKNKRMTGLVAPYLIIFIFLRIPNEIFKLLYAFKNFRGDMNSMSFMDRFWQNIFQYAYYTVFAVQPIMLCLFHRIIRNYCCSICRRAMSCLKAQIRSTDDEHKPVETQEVTGHEIEDVW